MDAITQCRQVLSEKGRLSTAIPGFVARQAQIALASAIAEAMTDKTILVAEAGTGTGKTYAYLIPCLLGGKKALISTATKTLQDQLFQKDLPELVRALGRSVRVQNLKGRANYICRYRTKLHAKEGRFISQQSVHEVLHIHEKLAQLTSGERAELPEISEDSPVWPLVTSTADNCLGGECEFHRDCFLVKARKRALDADVVVINHHLFFADSRLKEDGFGELLPGVDVVIFDEAHQLADIAAHFNGQRLGTRQIRDLTDDLLREWPVLDLVNQPLKAMSLELDKIIDQLLLSLDGGQERLSWQDVSNKKSFQTAWQSLRQHLADLIACVEGSGQNEHAGIQRCLQRLTEFQTLASRFADHNTTQIRWLERFKHTLVFHMTPFDIAKSFRSLLGRQPCAYVFTSATLTMASSFDCFTRSLGLTEAQTLQLESPFDYRSQALLYLPRDLPDPKDKSYYDALLRQAVPLIEACGGRCFFLFTSHRALQKVAQLMHNNLKYPLLIQGDEAKPILLARFRQLGNAVLLGTATFWEGVDVKGEALSCVIIDKLPFASPVDPVIRGKMAYFKEQGLSGFDELSLPNAVLALKQGVGRLIRDASDRGVLMIADPRLTGREYGRHIFASLPQLRKTRDQQTVLNFINELALNDETTGH
ncbi:ATP dependent DNA helicase (DEAD box family) Rad3 [Legionella spiritensis]|uniref:DNA 5'-3' helicase n=1 Tax=Legionella spiritensis TaxID=452 RepID=A0A0W0Z9C4_LEGSP|nr:ATP dependent DNA helicase (DEAD box family) Rad3 [Legionella spiritensis]SNV43809.1 ATP dependent DNA helicase (DEAD box family) Rad3 [Legionella spiritensis]VEG90700.1 ATP dependent DNA helicase (DEAD box family) Rad3 [Legionella spiritensis]